MFTRTVAMGIPILTPHAALCSKAVPRRHPVVTKLGRLTRSVSDARTIADRLLERGVGLTPGTTVYDQADPSGKMLFKILATFAGFENDVIRMRTREGLAIAWVGGKLCGRRPALSDLQARDLRRLHDAGECSVSDLARAVFGLLRDCLPHASAAAWGVVPKRRRGVPVPLPDRSNVGAKQADL